MDERRGGYVPERDEDGRLDIEAFSRAHLEVFARDIDENTDPPDVTSSPEKITPVEAA